MPRTDEDDDEDEPFEFPESVILAETERAVRVRTSEGLSVWVPKSVIHDDSEIWETSNGQASERGTLVVEGWWARKNNYS